MRKVIIVDDDDYEIALARRSLSSRQFEVIQVRPNEDALAAVSEVGVWALFITQNDFPVEEGLILVLKAAHRGASKIAFLADSVPEVLDGSTLVINEALVLINKGHEFLQKDAYGRDWGKIIADLTFNGPGIISVSIPMPEIRV